MFNYILNSNLYSNLNNLNQLINYIISRLFLYLFMSTFYVNYTLIYVINRLSSIFRQSSLISFGFNSFPAAPAAAFICAISLV